VYLFTTRVARLISIKEGKLIQESIDGTIKAIPLRFAGGLHM
jgi:hypothetical protein